MSSPLAIAAVTAVLKDLLNDGLINHDISARVGSFSVTSLPPDRIETGAQEPNQLNVFLYAVTPNAGWRNANLPSVNGGGSGRLSNPPLALDLHYLLTAYGQTDLNAEIILGYSMFLLHQMPVLTRAAIRTSLANVSPVTPALLPKSEENQNAADLADQIEQVKLTPQALSVEEISRIWTALQARYRPSAAYQASVVLIQATTPTTTALPVRRPSVTVVPLRRPTIASVEPQLVVPGASLVVRGQNLKAPRTLLSFGAIHVSPDLVADEWIETTVPPGLRAGVNTVQVRGEVDLSNPRAPAPATPHPGIGFESNVAAFVLAPVITSQPPLTVARGAALSLDLAPLVASDQRVVLLIGDQALPLPARSDADPPAATLSFPVPATFAPGTYLLRVQVDGSQSLLQADTDAGSPTFSQYIAPQVTVT